jgi:hypothetical protein
MKHKWGDIRMTGHEINVLVAMRLATHRNPGLEQFKLTAFVIERADNHA